MKVVMGASGAVNPPPPAVLPTAMSSIFGSVHVLRALSPILSTRLFKSLIALILLFSRHLLDLSKRSQSGQHPAATNGPIPVFAHPEFATSSRRTTRNDPETNFYDPIFVTHRHCLRSAPLFREPPKAFTWLCRIHENRPKVNVSSRCSVILCDCVSFLSKSPTSVGPEDRRTIVSKSCWWCSTRMNTR